MARRNQLNAVFPPAPLGAALVVSGNYVVWSGRDGKPEIYRIDDDESNDQHEAGVAVRLGLLADIDRMDEFSRQGARKHALKAGATACYGLTLVGA